MRTDIKLGVVVGLGFLGVMAWYVTGRDTPDPIPVVDSSLGNQGSAQADSGSAALPPPVINRLGDRSKKPGSSAGGAKSKSPSREPVPGKVALAKLAARGGDRRKTVRPTSAAARTTTRPGTPARAMANTALDIKTGLSGKKDAKPPLVVPPGRELAPTIRPEREASVTSPVVKPPVDATPITKTTRDRPDKSPPENRVPILPRLKDETTGRSEKVIRPMSVPRARPKERFHRIEKYDTFAVLAEKYYGSQRYAGLLAKANPQAKDPRRLKLGMKLRIPTKKDLLKPTSTRAKEAKGRAGATGKKSGGTDTKSTEKEKVYIVKRDESFYSIARKVWGKSSRWRELHKLNKDVCPDPRDLRPGMKLRISAPKSAKAKKTSSIR